MNDPSPEESRPFLERLKKKMEGMSAASGRDLEVTGSVIAFEDPAARSDWVQICLVLQDSVFVLLYYYKEEDDLGRMKPRHEYVARGQEALKLFFRKATQDLLTP